MKDKNTYDKERLEKLAKELQRQFLRNKQKEEKYEKRN